MDLLEVTKPLNAEQMDKTFKGERWSIGGVLKHVADAEAWYLDRLDMIAEKYEELPENVFERLELVRTRLLENLPVFEDMKR